MEKWKGQYSAVAFGNKAWSEASFANISLLFLSGHLAFAIWAISSKLK